MANNSKNGVLGLILGIGAGVVAATAGFFAANKVAKEIDADSQSMTIVSPNEINLATITCGSSLSAKGLTLIKVKAENGADDCSLSFLAGKSCNISFEWKTDDHLEILVSTAKTTKVCDVNFEEKGITITLYVKKNEK